MTGQVAHLLDEEHNQTLDLLAAAEQAYARVRGDGPRDEALVRVTRRLHEHLVHHVPKHFGFEEQVLFPRLIEAGERDICELLDEEHDAIEAVIAQIDPLAPQVATLDAADFEALKRAVLDLAMQLRAHIEKETMGLVPLCDDHLPEDDDQAIALAYASA
jgi:iron-sulfur cluster repair protein YtfE (RIC family)